MDELTEFRRDAIEGLRQPLGAERSVEIERDGENRIVRLKKRYDAAPEPGTLEVVRDRAGRVKALRKVFAGGIRRSAGRPTGLTVSSGLGCR